MRASEQVRMNLGYMKHNVNLVALGSGVGMDFLEIVTLDWKTYQLLEQFPI